MKWYVRIGNTLLILFALLFCLFIIPEEAWSEGRMYKEKEKDKIYVTCRLAKKKIVLTQKICLYQGPNKTTDTVFISRFEHCPPSMRCIYEPNKQAPMIQEMLESIEDAMRNNK
tara:strand:- start:2099 stop:2440 length:342 start_codon:yes stop_codon:yes gene_type:complete